MPEMRRTVLTCGHNAHYLIAIPGRFGRCQRCGAVAITRIPGKVQKPSRADIEEAMQIDPTKMETWPEEAKQAFHAAIEQRQLNEHIRRKSSETQKVPTASSEDKRVYGIQSHKELLVIREEILPGVELREEYELSDEVDDVAALVQERQQALREKVTAYRKILVSRE